MKKIVGLFLLTFTLNVYSEDLVKCYLQQSTAYKGPEGVFSSVKPVEGSSILFEHNTPDIERIVVIEGVSYRLLVKSGLIHNVVAYKPTYLDFAVAKEREDGSLSWVTLHKRTIYDDNSLNGHIDIPEIMETEVLHSQSFPDSEDIQDKTIQVRGKCEIISEKEAIIETFNKIHESSFKNGS